MKFIVHLIGDIHQPLHNIDDSDADGNGKVVKFFDLQGYNGAPPNLHQVWDDGIINHSGKTVAQIIEALGQQNSSEVYVLDNDTQYFEAGLPVVKEQLRKAGLRLGRF